jgi:hypothetical protein
VKYVARNIKVGGPYNEPPGGYGRTGPARRSAYWSVFGKALLREKRAEILLGVGGRKNGSVGTLRQRKHPRADGADGAVLAPHEQSSRTWRLLAYSATPRGVTLFWRGHGRKSWSTVLGYHADGLGRFGRVPVRDHFVVSPAGVERAYKEASAWWTRTAHRPRPGPPGPSVPLPTPQQAPPAPKPVAAQQPKAASRRGLLAAAREWAEKYPYMRKYLLPPKARRL